MTEVSKSNQDPAASGLISIEVAGEEFDVSSFLDEVTASSPASDQVQPAAEPSAPIAIEAVEAEFDIDSFLDEVVAAAPAVEQIAPPAAPAPTPAPASAEPRVVHMAATLPPVTPVPAAPVIEPALDVSSFLDEVAPAAPPEAEAVPEAAETPAAVETAEPAPAKANRFAWLAQGLPAAALAFAVISSTASVGGLLIASRTIAKANIVLEDAEAREAKLHAIEKLANQIEVLNTRQQTALAKVDTMVAIAKPATTQDVRGAMNELQVALAKILPATNGEMNKLRDSQTELANRIGVLYTKIDNIERSVSSSPRAPRAGDREPTS